MISPTRNELLLSLVDYIVDATGLAQAQIIRGKQNSPAPLDTYCSVLYVTDTPNCLISKEITEFDSQTLQYLLYGERYYSFSVQFYRANATDLAKQLMMYHETPEGQAYQLTGLFTVRDVQQVEEGAVVMSDNYEERAILMLELIVNETQTILVNKVAELTTELNYEYGGEIISQTITTTGG